MKQIRKSQGQPQEREEELQGVSSSGGKKIPCSVCSVSIGSWDLRHWKHQWQRQRRSQNHAVCRIEEHSGVGRGCPFNYEMHSFSKGSNLILNSDTRKVSPQPGQYSPY